jgi:beta-galactosidase
MAVYGMLAAGACFFTVSAATGPWSPQASSRVTMNFDRGWLYDSTNNAAFSTTGYSDGAWSKVCLPHANIYVPHMYMNAGNGSSTYGSGAAWEFISWYRKHYTPPASYNGLRFLLQFEGVATVCSVYVNGTKVGTHSGAYTPFTVDITKNIVFGSDNVIAVCCNSLYQAEVPPEGGHIDYGVFGGIVRNVYLVVAPPLYTEYNFVYMPNCSTANCTPSGIVTSVAKIQNTATVAKKYTVLTSIVDHSNTVVATGTATGTIPAQDSIILPPTTLSTITNLHLWSPDTPYLYAVYTQVMDSSTYVDQFNDTTGFRSIFFGLHNVATNCAFYLNGKLTKPAGLDRHETFPFFGRAAAPRLQKHDADILKGMGCNCVRCSHYPQAPDFIKECDRVGIMLIQEVPGWQYLGDATWDNNLFLALKEMIARDRNRPSVVSWGVRVNESPDDNTLYIGTNDTARSMDPSRPTYGPRMGSASTADYLEDIWAQTSTGGTATGPLPFFASESGDGDYPWSWFPDDSFINGASSSCSRNISAQSGGYTNQYCVGTLGWCAFDYESPHPHAWNYTSYPAMGPRAANSYIFGGGAEDQFRIPKITSNFWASQRNPGITANPAVTGSAPNAAMYGPMVFIASDWLPSSPTTVTVFSNCDSVQLYLNGTSEGTKKGTDGTGLPHPAFQWGPLTYVAGTLKAVGYYKGVVVATHQITTPSAPVKLVLTPDTTTILDGGDMTRVVVSLVDSTGRFVRSRADSISMSATGAGLFIGELRSALEGGQFAFYVKSQDGVAGAINCQASLIGNTTIAAATATVNVVLDSAYTGVRGVRSNSIIPQTQTMFRTFMGTRFQVPASAGKNALMSVYDLAGKLLYRKTVSPMQKIDLAKAFGASSATYIVKFEGKQPAAW